jgi:Cu2+-exporting ATPase
VGELKRMGIRCMMLTGDSRAVAKTVAAELELDDFFAEVLPEEKAAKIREVQGRGLTVSMVGDGVNDAPALTQSDLGIAIGAGTEVAIESADVVLVRSDPRDVAAIIGLARKTYRKMVQNLACRGALGDRAYARLRGGADVGEHGDRRDQRPPVGEAVTSAKAKGVALSAHGAQRAV